MGGPGGYAGIDVCEGCSDRGVIRVGWSAGGGGRSWVIWEMERHLVDARKWAGGSSEARNKAVIVVCKIDGSPEQEARLGGDKNIGILCKTPIPSA